MRPATAAAQGNASEHPKALNPHEWKMLRILSDMIIPADDRSGSATQAGVPEFIDDWLNLKRGTLLDQIRGGLTWLDMQSNRSFNYDFADCSTARQKQILDRIAYPKKLPRRTPAPSPSSTRFATLLSVGSSQARREFKICLMSVTSRSTNGMAARNRCLPVWESAGTRHPPDGSICLHLNCSVHPTFPAGPEYRSRGHAVARGLVHHL